MKLQLAILSLLRLVSTALVIKSHSFLENFNDNNLSFSKRLVLIKSKPISRLSKFSSSNNIPGSQHSDSKTNPHALKNVRTGLKSAKGTMGNKAKDLGVLVKNLPSKAKKKPKSTTSKWIKEELKGGIGILQQDLVIIKDKVNSGFEGSLKIIKEQSHEIKKKISKVIPEELENTVDDFQKVLRDLGTHFGDGYEKELGENLKYFEKEFSKNEVKKSLDTVTNQISTISEAKYKALFAATSYCDLSQVRKWTCSRCQLIKGITKVNVFEDRFSNTQGYVAVNHRTKEIIVAFRGSSNLKNWMQNTKGLMVDYKVEPWVKVQVHNGFKQCMEGLSPYYTPLVRRFLVQYPDYRLSLIGHSLGGAVASLATVDLKNSLGLAWDKIELTTFGQPRVGNLDWAKWFNKQGMKCTRVVNHKDIVPNLPPRMALYAHFYTELTLEEELDELKPAFYKKVGSSGNDTKVNSFFDINKHIYFWGIHLGSGC